MQTGHISPQKSQYFLWKEIHVYFCSIFKAHYGFLHIYIIYLYCYIIIFHDN